MIARDLAGRPGPRARQRTDTRELENNILWRQLHAGEDAPDHLQKVIDLLVGAAYFIGIVHRDVRRPDQHVVVQRKDQHNAPIFILEKELMVANGLSQFLMADDKMGAFRPADIPAREAQLAVRKIDPRAGGVDDQLRLHIVCIVGDLVAEDDGIFTAPDHADII